jgi:hypothetical protein
MVAPERQESKINLKNFIICNSPNIIKGKAVPHTPREALKFLEV